MFFWIFMLICVLLIPLVMIIFGYKFKKSAPEDINYVYGYRTAMSTQSRDTWEFAHNYFGKLWLILGIIILIPSVIGMFLVIGSDNDTVGYTGMAITFVQILFLVIPIIPTEIALKKNFDENGDRKL